MIPPVPGNITYSIKFIINDELSERSQQAQNENHNNITASQNLDNISIQGNIISQPKLIINDEQSQMSESSQSEYYNCPPRLIQQSQQQDQYYQASKQPFLEQTKYSNLQYNQVSSNIVQFQYSIKQFINDHNHGLNIGINKIFGCCVTLIWAIIAILDYLLVFYAMNYEIQAYSSNDKYIGIVCFSLMLVISLIAYIIKLPVKVSKCASGILFFIFIASSIESSQGFLYFMHHVQVLYLFYCFFQMAQFQSMISAFFYLLCSKNKPSAKQIIKISIVFSILISPCKYWLFQFLIDQQQGLLIYLQVDIWICLIFCPLLNIRLVRILEQIYRGNNKKIQRDNICQGFILFKLYFFIPGI